MFSANTSQVAAADTLYVEDVFSTYLYQDTNNYVTVNNGIDLLNKGGMVWLKLRNGVDNHRIADTARGAGYIMGSNTTAAQVYESAVSPNAFYSNGFRAYSSTGETWTSWSFRKAAKFFDVVTVTGQATQTTFNHSLGVAPGMIIIKDINNAGTNWFVYHRSTGSDQYLQLESTNAQAAFTGWCTATSTSVTVKSGVMGNGNSFVVYLFAHDAASDGIIQCGSFTTDGSGSVSVNLGWEPQWVLYKTSATTSNWRMIDNMRGFPVSTTIPFLSANLSNAEATASLLSPTATGFTTSEVGSLPASTAYIYIAIRRGPMRTPTSGTNVFSPQIWTGNGTNRVVTAGGVSPDLFICGQRTSPFSSGKSWWNKLAGQAKYMVSTATGAEQPTSDSLNTSSNAFLQDGIALGENINMSNTNYATSATYAGYFFKRAPSFFDVVCLPISSYSVNGNHNLGVAPEMIIGKRRDSSGSWFVYHTGLTGVNSQGKRNEQLLLNSDAAKTTAASDGYFVDGLTATSFETYWWPSSSGTAVLYLFVSCPGVSKVGSYTGNGSSQTINCGFAAGARFVMIKRTDSTGDWYVWDSARGIVAGNDPRLSLNSTAAEVTTDDSVDTDSSGFVVNQLSATNINVSSATYIYLAVA